ncbi:hypothetical protein Tco_0621063 [Tanacetum coccineum]
MSESAKRHEENSNLIKEIRASTDAAIRNQGASIKTLKIQIRKVSKVLQEKGFGRLPSSTETNPRDQVKSISTSIKADSNSIRCIGSNQYDVSTGQNIGEENIIFKSVKPASSIIKRVYMLSLRERMELDLEARLMRETLVINRSLDHFLEDYIALNDLNEPFKLRRNQGNDLMPTIEEGEVIEEFRIRNDDLDTRIDDYPSYCDDDKKIHIDCAHNLKFSCMIGFEFTHANFSRYYFAVLENMDAYRDEGMGDVIFGEPFLREVDIKAKRFERMITLYKCDDEVTYQMVRSHPRFKHLTNEQCNRIPPLLKVNEKDVMNGVSHAYQKLKGFYKGVLNLGPDYIQNAKTEEWLTRGHISVHELE